jgi:hypothetical protein
MNFAHSGAEVEPVCRYLPVCAIFSRRDEISEDNSVYGSPATRTIPAKSLLLVKNLPGYEDTIPNPRINKLRQRYIRVLLEEL